ncbi:MAG TPA: SRPBCC family protein [Methylomusa anaerophila]|uniref:Putative polyketide cyclase n=1 Tax=Methylomusa anaerophila TaxID=1930071 RepID=A0A348AIQ6_9FIRM|nr:SRPBCC family protein [Methylomusa anaerophila]BBB90954.1 putative polyketide cyclase [Methylomusa anaerophila]HML90419.1 SRPBCC family protein [Methylomusa anaerophila]
MEVTMHAVEINADLETVYDMCANVLKWPEYFPPCKQAKIISEKDNVQVIEITAQSNETEFTWQSERILYPGSYRIDFRQSRPGPLVKYMQGVWRAIKLNKGVLLTLEHAFEVKDSVEGLVENVSNKEEALRFMHRTIENNSKQELGSIKRILEKAGLGEAEAIFSSGIEIKTTAGQVYNLLYNVQEWPKLLPHCQKITMLYEDGRNQEFEMTVTGAQDKTEVMRSIRHGYANNIIEYFQPSLPPALQRHEGKWIITGTENGVHLEAWHSITLLKEGVRKLWGEMEMEKALKIVQQAIDRNSMTTMQTIKSYLE